MASARETAASSGPSRARCRCGHLPTHHMVVAQVASGGSYRLDPTGPCAVCGETVCRRFSPGGSAPA